MSRHKNPAKNRQTLPGSIRDYAAHVHERSPVVDEHTPLFGHWLRRRRKSLDLSQLDLAERANCSPDTIQKIEAGTRRPSRQVAALLAEALAVPPDERPAFVRYARGQQPAPTPHEAAEPQTAAVLHLPPQLTSLIGREHEIAQIGELLLRPGVRLLTLIGPPGIGKTRLGIEAAASYAERFADGACFVALAAVEDPDLVVSSIAQALGLKDGAGRPLEGLKRYLHGKQLLLVLDNFEQVLDAAPVILELLGACPRLSVLATSREALHIPGERQYPVPLLATPDLGDGRSPSATRVETYAAVRLFAERSTAVNPGFRVSDGNAAAVAGICARLDGLPLAIELAAARAKFLSPHELLTKLDSSLALLTGGSRHLPPRQRTLRGAIEWSYLLLGENERQLFNRVGVFAGGCTLEAAAAVALPVRESEPQAAAEASTSLPDRPAEAPGAREVEALDALASLVDKSLLRQAANTEGASRFYMLETMREYATERLRESGELRAARLAHAEYFLKLAETAMPQLLGSEQASWLHRLENEHDNVRAALGWLAGGGPQDVEMALRICCFVALFWDIRGHLFEGRRWLSLCLERAEQWTDKASAEAPEPVSTAIRARAYKAAGNLANQQGDAAIARGLQLRSLELYRQIGDLRGEASTCMNLGNAAYSQGDYAASRAWHEQALELFRRLADTAHIAMNLNNLGNDMRALGDHDLARTLQEESLAIQRELGDSHNVSIVLNNLGEGALQTGDLRRARALLEQGLSLAKQLDYKYGMAYMLTALGRVAVEERAYGPARTLLEQAHALSQQLGDDSGMAYCLASLAALAQAQGEYIAARAHLKESLKLYQAIGSGAGSIGSLERLAQVHAALGEARNAARLLGAAAQWRSAGAPMPPVEQAGHARAIAAAREQLGQDEYDRAWAEGQALAPEEAIVAALAGSVTSR